MYLFAASRLIPPAFYDWSQTTFIGRWIQESTWVFAVTETVHIMALAVLLGSLLVIDLRLLGLGLRRQTTAQLVRELNPWTWGSMVFMAITGIMMFTSEAVRMGQSGPFKWKVCLLIAAVVLHFTIHRNVSNSPERDGGALAKVAAVLSLCCWLGVALAGRAIAFL